MHQAQLVAEQVLPRDIVSGASAIASACPAQPGKSRRLLWVDDSEVLLSLYKAVFEHLGFEVLASASPERTLDKLSSAAADVAILDYDMPEINGGDLASAIKDQFPTLPVILYTAKLIPHTVRCCVDAVCAKAAPREDLLTTIERLLGASQLPSLAS